MSLVLPEQELIELPKKRFPKELSALAKQLEIRDEVFRDRLPVNGFTVDGPTSRDLDDAIWLEKTDQGFLVQVSIADVDELVKIFSPLDQEALNRTTTIYFPDHNIPMMPRVLSENRLSLLEGKPRPTLTVSIQINRHLRISSVDIRKTYLTSSRRLSHNDFHLGRSIGKSDLKLLDYLQLAKALNSKRRSEESLAFQQFPGGISTDEEGVPSEQLPTHGHLVVQEFMILANRAVAEKFAEHRISAPFRNHLPLNGHAPTRADIIAIIENNSDYLKLVDNIRELFHQFLSAASYEGQPHGHYGLNIARYLHFTSPIRRYADLISHRQAKSLIEETEPPYSRSEIEALCRYLNSRARRILTLRAAEANQQASNSLQQYRRNYHLLNEGKSPEKQDNLEILQALLYEHRIGNVRFDFRFDEGINLLLGCTAWIKYQRQKIEVTVSAHADKMTVRDLAAKKLLRKIRELLRDSPEIFVRHNERAEKQESEPSDNIVSKLYQYCRAKELKFPSFHYETWSGNSNLVGCYCQISELVSVSGYGNRLKEAKEAAAQKMLNYLVGDPKFIPPQAFFQIPSTCAFRRSIRQ
jgi:hypothetical protein